MKKHIALTLAVVLMLSLAPLASFAAGDVKVELEGTAIAFPDAKPFVDQNDRTLVPLSPVATAMGIKVDWDQTNQTATFTQEYTKENAPVIDTEDPTHKGDYFLGKECLVFTVGKTDAAYSAYYYDMTDQEKKTPIEGRTFTKTIAMDTAAVNESARVYAPVKYLAETFGCVVSWDGATSTVSIISNNTNAIEFLGNGKDYVALGYFASRWHGMMGSPEIQIQSVTVDGKAVTLEAFTAEELASIKGEYTNSLLSGGRIKGDFAVNTSHKIEITVEYKEKGGMVYAGEPIIIEYAPKGYGGML